MRFYMFFKAILITVFKYRSLYVEAPAMTLTFSKETNDAESKKDALVNVLLLIKDIRKKRERTNEPSSALNVILNVTCGEARRAMTSWCLLMCTDV